VGFRVWVLGLGLRFLDGGVDNGGAEHLADLVLAMLR
jgi:hypothetical protein